MRQRKYKEWRWYHYVLGPWYWFYLIIRLEIDEQRKECYRGRS